MLKNYISLNCYNALTLQKYSMVTRTMTKYCSVRASSFGLRDVTTVTVDVHKQLSKTRNKRSQNCPQEFFQRCNQLLIDLSYNKNHDFQLFTSSS